MKDKIIAALARMRRENESLRDSLEASVSVSVYKDLAYVDEKGRYIWTKAIQRAIDENQSVTIPSAEHPYYVDKTLILPSNRRIKAHKEAHICKIPEMDTVLLRNKNVRDGSHAPIPEGTGDCNITVTGGIWEDTDESNTLYHGMFDSENSMPGVDACFFFNNMTCLNIREVRIVRAGGFGIQIGNLENAVIEDVEFVATVADGVHINGNTKNVIVRNIFGNVADDIVALNMYDWQRSSVCFGSVENLLCENITLADEAKYKAIRVLPGKYYYDDGTVSNCDVNNVIIRNVRGISTFKFYFQTPPYPIGGVAEQGNQGRGNNIFIQDVDIHLFSPIDAIGGYLQGDPVTGTFAAFEFGSFLGKVELKDIRIHLDQEKFPASYLACIGPKSARTRTVEIFDPDLSSELEELVLDNVTVNGETVTPENVKQYVHEIVFSDLYGEGGKTSSGRFKKITFKSDGAIS